MSPKLATSEASPLIHWLVVNEKFVEDDENLYVQHDENCPREHVECSWITSGYWEYACQVENEISCSGIEEFFVHCDDLMQDFPGRAERVSPGRYEIEAWSERIRRAGPWGDEEWEGGLRIVGAGSTHDESTTRS